MSGRSCPLVPKWNATVIKGKATLRDVAVRVSAPEHRAASAADVCSCPQCGRLSDHAHLCPLDGSFIQLDPDGVSAAVAERSRTAETSGSY